MRFAVLLAFVLALAACAGPSGTTRPSGDDDPPPPTEPGYPAYETFDPSGYDVHPARPARPIEHDVPARLMEGRVEVPADDVEREVDGFRIQVFSGEDRRAAEGVRAEADAWARDVRGQDDALRNLESDVLYQQPYYRVRIGAFEYRDEAEAALAFVRQ